MDPRLPRMKTLLHRLPLGLLVLASLLLLSSPTRAQTVEVIVEDPQLHPAYTTCPESYWYPFTNDRGYNAYLTLNVKNPVNSANYAEWHPVIPQAGYYRVSAYIGAHSAITWCTGTKPTIPNDTSEARYAIHYAFGVSNQTLSQFPLSNQWLDLGEYYFTAGQSGYVSLADLNAEPDFSTTISFSAMRFTYTRPTRPQVFLPFVGRAEPSVNPPGGVGILQAPGFDGCHLPEVSEMHTWWHQSPYAFYALYLGGSQLSSVCSLANAAWVSQVHQQGWSFVPTWVGPQAPCTTYTQRMSSDPSVSYQQGRQEAEAASAAAISLGLSSAKPGGTIIYYDLEAYGYSTPECRQPVSAFMNGWVQRLHELGNLAGGYGTRNSFITDWWTIANVPDEIWPASWYASAYDPYATVFGIPWLQGLWTNHQRIRQYAGDHPEHWGGVGLAIDSDVADGIVALPPAGVLSNLQLISTPSIDDTGWISAQQGWLVSGGRLYWTTDSGKAWQDISPAAVQKAYFLPSKQGWAIATTDQGGMIIYHSPDGGNKWESLDIPLPPETWQPLQLKFTSPASGWMVLQKATSQAFNIGILMKTSDAGVSWHTYALPYAAAVEFTSEKEGRFISEDGEEPYFTTDGGLTWLPGQVGAKILSQPSLPAGTSHSGWGNNGLGWAVTNEGSCSGDKTFPGFTCQANSELWTSQDGGQTWDSVPLP